MLEIKVKEIRGGCPVYKVGDKVVVDNPRVLLARKTTASIPLPMEKRGNG